MKAECASTVFHVSDQDAALAYYTGTVGFSLDFRYGPLIGVLHGAVSIHLCGHDPEGNKQPAGNGHIYIFCDEVDVYFRDINARGAVILTPPDDRAYGMRDFAVKDPDGNILAFGQSIHS